MSESEEFDASVSDVLREANVKNPGDSERLMALLISEVRLLREATAGLRWAVENEFEYMNERRRSCR